MTKEEQLGKYPIVANNDGTVLYIHRKSALKSMDEWAIAFGKWIQGCNYAPATDDGKWQNQLPCENEIITTEELYQMFENQNK